MTIRKINLALQGGGAHGAFTWGVLDRLLEDETIEIAGISGTSAGALNGAALKVGLVKGGRAAAKENLDWLWMQVGAVGDMRLAHWFKAFMPMQDLWSDLTQRFAPFSPGETFTRIFSPYDFGPFYVNPLERIVSQFHFDCVGAETGPAFFVAATNVRSGKIRVFSGKEITTEAILASACLPTIFRAVEIDDTKTGSREAYWDGGYAGNPALFPLFDPELPRDIVVVNINPLYRENLPFTSQDILDRINEVSFNSSLLREFRAINFVKKLIAQGAVGSAEMKDVLVHIVSDDDLMTRLSASSKLSPTAGLLWELKGAGRAAADTFLERDSAKLNVESSVDLQQLFN